MKPYSFERTERVSQRKWPKAHLEYGLIPKKLAEHMANGYQLVN